MRPRQRVRVFGVAGILASLLGGCTDTRGALTTPDRVAAVSDGPAPGAPVGFVFFGDGGTGRGAQRHVASAIKTFCASELCGFVALTGDNIYDDGVASSGDDQFQTKFEQPYADLPMKFYATPGNHDHLGDVYAEVDYSTRSPKWVMPGRYFRYVMGDVEFFVIDTDNFDEDQERWLDTKLGDSHAKWKIVYGHHPVFSYGFYGDTPVLKDHLLPLLTRHHVDFYLCGHEHDQQVIQASGLVAVVSGGGGETLRTTGAGPRTLFARSGYGFGHLRIENGLARLRMVDDRGRTNFDRTFTK